MYIPEHFKEENLERIAALIRDNAFGMLITAPQGQPFVSHLPFLFERSGAQGKLLGHMARANPHWQHFSDGADVLVVFHGPHAYVSPSWYASPGVPTWNYAVAHLRGKPRRIETESELEALLERQTHVYEQHMPNPWKPNLTGERRTKLLGMIVGFEIEISDIQGKFKLGQNRSAEDRLRVIAELNSSTNQTEVAVAKLMS
ncbi:MAG: FMN-binding negative transcriptional regulator [Gammaproteobacteria bacterium]|nr:FMN-binding negative transcriptional regulator [Gammaproteobacteria bacterium]MBU1407939.1 FMN-binding negative transcriptional regulator [Gammaproteobacteria bacterium]MBU1532052.1 FMN-binding negative transcriptional regulator [Gammaproteobacteria bacterium]